MKIIIIGPRCTGKTHLAKLIQGQYSNATLVECESGLLSEKKADEDIQGKDWIVTAQSAKSLSKMLQKRVDIIFEHIDGTWYSFRMIASKETAATQNLRAFLILKGAKVE